jgi:predicted restriction endonuclease
MKILISFIAGIIVCCLIIFGVKTVIPTARAETDNSGNVSENITQSLINLIPDFEKIYREALIMPFEKAEKKIYDEDIAEFYGELLDRTGLRQSASGSQ